MGEFIKGSALSFASLKPSAKGAAIGEDNDSAAIDWAIGPLSDEKGKVDLHEYADAVWKFVFELALISSISIILYWKHFYKFI